MERNSLKTTRCAAPFFALDSQDRLILSLHLFAGYTSREIGRELNMNENTVRSRESRALKKLADMLKE